MVRSEMSPWSRLPATNTVCYNLLNKVQPYFSDHEGLDERDARLTAYGTEIQSILPLAQGLKLHIIWRKRAKNIKFLEKRQAVGVKGNFCVWYEIGKIFI
jgi:hypothetical protein